VLAIAQRLEAVLLAYDTAEPSERTWQPIALATDQSQAPWDGKPVLILTNHTWMNPVHRAIWTDTIHGGGIFGWAVEGR